MEDDVRLTGAPEWILDPRIEFVVDRKKIAEE